jgi:hypothetical protein
VRNVKYYLAFALFLSGCPGTCGQQVRRDYQRAAEFEVKTGEAKIEDRKVESGGKTRKTHLRPDGTAWLIEDDLSWVTDLTKTQQFKTVDHKGKETVIDKTERQAWWKFPLMVLSCAVVGALLALVFVWGFRRWKRG